MRTSFITGMIILLTVPHLLTAQAQPYMPGEKVSYQIRYGPVNGGLAYLELKEGYYNGKQVWHAVVSGKTTGLADAVYRVRDTYESYIDPETDLPVFSIRNISEGKYRKYNEVSFDHATRSDSVLLFSNLSGNHTGPRGILDIVSGFYWFRKYHLAAADSLVPGEIFSMTTWFADELYPIILKYRGKETIRVNGNKIACYRFHPVTEVGRVFKTEEDMAVWFTADENFLPVKIRFDIFVGSFIVDMISFEGLKEPITIN
ncbi:MAG: DUF3108 domain-containing protein [Bacteroidales bacterium]|nr:DUF3108 domain-containing protein [Bacteroidales bacterium]